MDHSNIIFDFELDFLEQYQTETLLQILKDKYGKGTRIKATGDSSFEYSCPCPIHKDGRNPNGRVAFAVDGTIRLYCNGKCSQEGNSTWFFRQILERLEVDSTKLAQRVRDNLTELKKEIPPKHLNKVAKGPELENQSVSLNSIVPDSLFVEFLEMAQNSMSQALRDDLKELGYGEKTISRAGFISGSPTQYQKMPQEFQGKRLNEFRSENRILKSRVACFIFPHFHQSNQLWSLTIAPVFKGQTELENKTRYASDETPKSYKLKGSKAVMDGLETLSDTEKELAITEGIKDADRIRQTGSKALASLGGLSRDQAEIIRNLNLEEIRICFDADDAGRGKTKEAIKHLAGIRITVLDLPEGKDPNDLNQEELKNCPVLNPDEWADKYDIPIEEVTSAEDNTSSKQINPSHTKATEPGPLKIDCYPKTGFIPLYLEYARPLTEARDQYHLASALSVLSAAYERRIFIEEGRRIHPNLYTAILGHSSASKKSTSIKLGLDLMDQVFPERLSLSNSFTPEGLQSAFGECPLQLIEIDELGGFLGQASKKSYMSGIVDILNSLYDCPPRFRKRLANDVLEFEKPFPVIICGAPFRWLAQEVDSTLKEGGFLARFQWFISLDRLLEEDLKPITPKRDESKRNKLIGLLEEIRAMEDENIEREFSYHQKSIELYCNFYKEQKLSLQNEKSEQIGPHVERLLTAVKKYALIFQASKKDGFTITEESMIEAINLCKWLRSNIEHLLLSHFHESKTDDLCQKALKIIIKLSGKKKEWIRWGDVSSRVRELDASNKANVIETLLDRELIEVQAGSKKPGFKEDYRGWKFRPAA